MNADHTQSGELSPTKRALLAMQELRAQLEAARQSNEPVAIVGMGCRYPGADGLDEFWRVLCEGIDAVSDVPPERWRADSFTMSPKGGFLKNIDRFDAAFFGISPREAPHVDPRQRVALEIAWEALEHAGIPPDSLAGSRTGVFLATLTNDYDHLLFSDLQRIDAYSGAGTANSIVANRISYFLDLRGPSLALDTACSGSLVAIQLACESLRKGESTLALAGGVNLNLMPKSSVFFHKAGALAADGRCKTFDASADGIVRSDGAGIIVLKLLSEARKSGDPIFAVIRGGAVNHDGRSNGIMAPNGAAQRELLMEAYRRADVSPAAVQMIEAHGTGTKLGDPIEVAALGEVLARGRKAGSVCSLGSLKTNIGHSEAAAGVGGVIKAALALHHRVIPPTLHFSDANPLIPFANFPLRVQQKLGPWPDESQTLIAGVSGFGFGGTNAHLVLEQAPAPAKTQTSPGPYVLPLSARTPEALASLAASYRGALTGNADAGDVCFTAAARRTHHAVRMAVVGESKEDLISELESCSPCTGDQKGPIGFVFSGQGSHWTGMARALYERYEVCRRAIDECHRLLGRDVVFSPLDATTLTQPAIFSIQVALGELWRSFGIEADFVVGHSLGEVAAAHFSGALSLEDAVRVVECRSRLMQTMEGKGKTAVIGLTVDQTRDAIARYPELSIAGSNSPMSTVISGSSQALKEAMRVWESRKIFCRLVPGVEIAFHSPQMDGIAAELAEALHPISPRNSMIPILSTVTGDRIEGEQLTASYWGRNLREPFLFTQATRRLVEFGCKVLLEVSPSPVLTSAMQQTVGQGLAILHSMRKGTGDVASMFGSLRKLYQFGWNVKWHGVYPSGNWASLPVYPWQRQRHWLDQLAGSPEASAKKAGKHPLLGERVDAAHDRNIHIWEIDFDARNPQYLSDHRVMGNVVVPASVWTEMALAAARDVFGTGQIAVRSLRFESALKLNPGEQRRVQVVLTGEKGEIGLYSRPDDGAAWTRHAAGSCGLETGSPPRSEALTAIQHRCSKAVPTEDHYAAMLAAGLEYGPAFRVHRSLHSGDQEALAQLDLPQGLASAQFACHPVLLDGALRVAAAALPATKDTYLPHEIGDWRVFGSLNGSVYCHARLHGQPGDAILHANLDLMDSEGRLVARLERLALKRLSGVAKVSALDDSLLRQQWVREDRPGSENPGGGRWLIVSNRSGVGEALARRLEERGCSVTVVFDGQALPSGPFHGAVHLASLDGDQGAISALRLAQTLVQSPARLWLVTRGAQPVIEGQPMALDQTPVAGLSLVIGQEHPELQCCHVDLGAETDDIAALAEELAAPSGETRVAWRGGARYVARLVKTSGLAHELPPIRADRTYLITGGFGALGLLTAKSLVSLGARHLVLTGRSGSMGKEAAMTELEALGARVHAAALDIASPEQTAKLFRETLAALPPLAGVVHSAGVLDDGMIPQQTPERFAKVMAPKVAGSWNLHAHTKDMALDFFLMYSSAASLIGSPGQSNYASANAYMDGLAHYRQSLGLPALSINWGAWDDDGMAAAGLVRDRLALHGVSPIDPRQGAELLTRLIGCRLPQVGVIPVEWPKFLRQFGKRVPALFAALAPAAQHEQQSFAERLRATPVAERAASLRRHVREELARVLRFEASAIGARQRFFDLGMDSLTALEFRNRLEADLEISLPATLAFDFPSLEALGDYLVNTVVAPAEGAPAPEMPTACPSQWDSLSNDELASLLAQELCDGGAVVQHA